MSIALAASHVGASSAAYAYQYCTTPSQYQYCSTSTSTTTTTTPTTTSTSTTTTTTPTTTSTSTTTTTTPTTTSTSTTTTTTPTETRPGKGCGDKNHLHERRFECKVTIADATIKEGKLGGVSSLVFTVELSGSPESVVTMNYASAGGTATSGIDFRAISGTLSFPVGVNMMKLTVPVIGDNKREPNETLYVNLSNVSPNAYFVDSQGLGTVTNDD